MISPTHISILILVREDTWIIHIPELLQLHDDILDQSEVSRILIGRRTKYKAAREKLGRGLYVTDSP
jgi:hypothetical protein